MRLALVLAALLVVGCDRSKTYDIDEAPTDKDLGVAAPAALSLTRLDCGHAEFKDMNGFFSDRPGVYPPGPGKVTDSCYLIRHGDQQMIWDTGLPASTRDKPMVQGQMTGAITVSLADQLQQLGLKPDEIDVVGISHMHGDHTGQAAEFAKARLLIGKGDFEMLEGKPEDTLGGWRGQARPVTLVTADTDVFGDGSVMAIHLPGHTPDHLALLVKLKSGPVLLSGDTYHSTIAREKKAVPGFNTSREDSLKSMDRFEKIAAENHANVIIQHEPNDIGKLPAFPKAAE